MAPLSDPAVTTGRRPDRVWLWFGLAGALVLTGIAVAFAVDALDVAAALYCPAVAAGPVGLVLGVRRHRPAVRAPWLLLAAAQGLFLAGGIVYAVLRYVDHEYSYPGPQDVLWVLTYPLWIAALMLFVRSRDPHRQMPASIDAALLSIATALATWLHLISPLVSAVQLGPTARIIGLAYPALDLLVLAMALRLALGVGRRPPAYYLLTGALAATLVADIAFSVQRLSGDIATDRPVASLGTAAAGILFGVAALHPSMTQLTERMPSAPPEATVRRVVILAATALLAPAELVYLVLRGDSGPVDLLVVAVASAVLVLLMLARIGGLAAAHRRLALTDPLTGVNTRRGFDPVLAAEIRRAHRSGRHVGVLIIDIDHFKRVNDTHGHGTGDEVLSHVPRRLRAECRPGDTIGRLGGEEFAVIVPAPQSAETLAEIAERMRGSIADQAITHAGGALHVTVSIGTALYPGDGSAGSELMRAADEALYAAKRSGRNRVVAASAPAAQEQNTTNLNAGQDRQAATVGRG